MAKGIKRIGALIGAFILIFAGVLAVNVKAGGNAYVEYGQGKRTIVIKMTHDGRDRKFSNTAFIVDGDNSYFCVEPGIDFKSDGLKEENIANYMSQDMITRTALLVKRAEEVTQQKYSDIAYMTRVFQQCAVWKYLQENNSFVRNARTLTSLEPCLDERSFLSQFNDIYAQAKQYAWENKDTYEGCGKAYCNGDSQMIVRFYCKEKPQKGKLKLKKSSVNANFTDNNSCYNLAGAEYTVSQNGTYIASLVTDEKGDTNELELTEGEYQISETKAPGGYILDKKVHNIYINGNQDYIFYAEDEAVVAGADFEIVKVDKDTGGEAQGEASLEGAEFTVNYYDGYYDDNNLPDKPAKSWVLKTIKKDGEYKALLKDIYKVRGDEFYYKNNEAVLPLGTISIKETKPPAGYDIGNFCLAQNKEVKSINGVYVRQIREDEHLKVGYFTEGSECKVYEGVIRGGVRVAKRDFATKLASPQANASLGGAGFDIISLNKNTVIVDGVEYGTNQVVKRLITGEDGIAETKKDLLPYGKYKIVETEAPAGYLLEGKIESEFFIKDKGETVDITDGDFAIYDKVKRGDIKGIKIGDGSHTRLSGVKFKITSKTTKESHIVVTDDNGEFNTSADWNKHSANTNKGESSEDGVWFYGASHDAGDESKSIGAPVDDTLGALPYDTYVIEEMEGESNKDFIMIPPFEVRVYRDSYTIDLGTLTDTYKEPPTIVTSAVFANGNKSMEAVGRVTVVDRVRLENLELGRKYKVVGSQMIKETNAVHVNGKKEPVMGESDEFIADKNTKVVDVEFVFDADGLAGKNVVVFEELMDITDEKNPKLVVAEHKDLENANQTVTFFEKPHEEKETESEPTVAQEEEKTDSIQAGFAPKTGDGLYIVQWAAVFGVCVSAAIIALRARSCKK